MAIEYQYVGFWARFGATLIDAFLLCLVTYPILIAVYGWEYFTSESFVQGPLDFALSWLLPAVVIIVFWVYKSATPGKIAIAAKIIDAKTGGQPSTGRFIVRYLGYFVSGVVIGIGYLWVAIDHRKQGWHDKLAGTLVVRTTPANQ